MPKERFGGAGGRFGGVVGAKQSPNSINLSQRKFDELEQVESAVFQADAKPLPGSFHRTKSMPKVRTERPEELKPVLEESEDVNDVLRRKAMVIREHYESIKEEWDRCCCGTVAETQLKANIFFNFVTDKSCMPVPYDEIMSAGGSVMNRSSFQSSMDVRSFRSSLHSVANAAFDL